MTDRQAIIVTGSAGGIGQVLCQQMSSTGYVTIGIDLAPSHAANHSIVLDLCDTDALRDFGAKIAEEHDVKALIHNAAFQPVAGAGETSTVEWLKAFRVNVLAADALVAGIRQSLRRNRGSVVVISSIHGRSTSHGITAYATTKAALEGWTRSAAIDLGPDVRVNAIAPGAIDTKKLWEGLARWPEQDPSDRLRMLVDRTPLETIGDALHVGAAARFLISDEASFITGTTLVVDGGASAKLATE